MLTEIFFLFIAAPKATDICQYKIPDFLLKSGVHREFAFLPDSLNIQMLTSLYGLWTFFNKFCTLNSCTPYLSHRTNSLIKYLAWNFFFLLVCLSPLLRQWVPGPHFFGHTAVWSFLITVSGMVSIFSDCSYSTMELLSGTVYHRRHKELQSPMASQT